MAVKGGKRDPGAGRKKGSVNKRTQTLIEKAEALGCDPYEILLHFAKGDWKALGYESGQKVKCISEDNGPIFEDQIPAELRASCAKDACQYLHPKRSAVALSTDEGGMEIVVRDYCSKAKE